VEDTLKLCDGHTSTGVAIVTGREGELYILLDSPPRLLRWDVNRENGGEFASCPGELNSPVDMTSDTGFELLVADPYNEKILRFDRRLEILPPIIPDAGGERFEPLSVCRIPDGTLFTINRTDDDIWRISRDGKATPLGWSPARSGRINAPSHIEYSTETDKLLVLDKDGLKLFSPYGMIESSISTGVADPSGIGVAGTEAWIAGDGLACVSLTHRYLTFYAPPDSLKSWGVFPAADVALMGNQRLYVLPERGDLVLVLKILRGGSGHP